MATTTKKDGLTNLTKKVAAVLGAALATLTATQPVGATPPQVDILNSKTVQLKGMADVKPMPVLKLNPRNPENGRLVSQHRSHSSHGSHGSHSSHSSHYSHRSGAMFS